MPINLYSKDSVDDLLDEKLSISSLSNAATVTLNAGVPTAGQALTYDGTDLIWATVSGGGLTISTLSNAATATLNAGVPSSGQALVFDGTDLAWQYPTVTWGAISGTLSSQMDLQAELDLKAPLAAPSFTGGITVDVTGITFSDSTVQTTAAVAGVSSDKIIANAFAASMWYAWDGNDYARNGVVNTNYIGGNYLSAGISDGTTFAAGFPATNATLDSDEYWYVSINGTLSDLFIFSP